MLRTSSKENQPCPRHSRYTVRDKKLLAMQIRETRKRDARRWWQDAIAVFVHPKRRNFVREFRVTRSDPYTQKPLYPFHVKKITLSQRYQEDNLPSDSV